MKNNVTPTIGVGCGKFFWFLLPTLHGRQLFLVRSQMRSLAFVAQFALLGIAAGCAQAPTLSTDAPRKVAAQSNLKNARLYWCTKAVGLFCKFHVSLVEY
jgi:hypothetical protein